LTGGAKSKRFALPHSRMMVHQPMGGFQGQATDFDIHAREILRVRERLNQIMVNHTGRAMDQIKDDTDRDYFMDGEEAKAFGLIDAVIEKRV
jgi:ATP-dependent Clp protease protease subunit